MHFKAVASLLAFVALSGCAGTRALYDFDLEEVDRSGASSYEAPTVVALKGRDKGKFRYSDDAVDLTWSIDSTGFGLELNNLTASPITVLWDDAAYINPLGESLPIARTDRPLNDKGTSQAASVLPKGGKLIDRLTPAATVPAVKENADRSHPPVFPVSFSGDLGKQQMATWKGKTFRLQLPLQVGDTRQSYVFTFRIDDVRTE